VKEKSLESPTQSSEKLRGMMPWIKSNALVDKTKN